MTYPVIDQGTLTAASKRGTFGLGAKERVAGEIPSPLPHQTVVVSDGVTSISSRDRRHGLRADHVIHATSWCLVDMTSKKPVTVQLTLQSSGVDEFTLRVTFACTVTDERLVAEAGHRDLTEPLLTYLKGYHKLYLLGIAHPIADSAQVHDNAQLELGIYVQASPPATRGMQIQLSSIEVLKPEDVLKEQREQEERLKAHRSQQLLMELEREQELTKRGYQRDDQQFAREMAAEEGQTERERQSQTEQTRRLERTYQRDEAEFGQEQRHRAMAADLKLGRMFADATADDPNAVIAHAVVRGDLDGNALIQRVDEAMRLRREDGLREEQRNDRHLEHRWEVEGKLLDSKIALDHERLRLDIEKESRAKQWEVTRDDREWEREKEKLRIEREITIAQQALESDRAANDREWEREKIRLDHAKQARDQDMAAAREQRRWESERESEQWDREQRARDQELQARIAEELIKRGQTDHADLAEVIVGVVRNLTGTPQVSAEQPRQIPGSLESNGSAP
ncbi:hypothetical protein [Nonomuraea soli]|uniref:Uncharacterized protein n=1 Tax=Nonomuraea soli TaxID=1032476 RepID=A0A7W0CHM2_9ACTN|nr:hypothetical protein [Nonomuraea soli]MBA2891303.1 hypothetical protein [Nonomuraea soli]